MPRSAASDLGLHCFPMSHKKDAMLIWVNVVNKKNSFIACLLQTRRLPLHTACSLMIAQDIQCIHVLD